MSAPRLIRHGENIKPHYAPEHGDTESWAGKSTVEERPDGNASGIVKRYLKDAGETVKTTLFPITMDGHRLGVRLDPPRLGQHSRELLDSAGFTGAEIDQLLADAVVA